MFRAYIRPLTRALVVVVVANLFFFALMIVTEADPGVFAARVRTAFETGDLGMTDYRRFDARRGYFQHNDCLVLQMLVNGNESRVEKAVAPKVYANENYNKWCATLHALVVERVDPNALQTMYYGRYWHGYNALAAIGLRALDLRNYRRLLSGGVFLAIGVLVLAASRSGPYVRRTGLTIGLAAATIWAVPYFAPGLTQGPGDALLILTLAVVASRPRMATPRLGAIVPFAAGFGAVVVFFEMFTGQLPTAAAWLAAITLASARDERMDDEVGASTLVLATLIAFGLGAAATVAIKQILALSVVGSEAGRAFLEHLGHYTSVPASEGNKPGILLPFVSLVRQSSMLTYGSKVAGYVLLGASGLAWLAAAIRSWKRPDPQDRLDFLILLCAALIPFVWVLLVPRHTYIHAWLMVRILVVPISLSAVALGWYSTGQARRDRDPLVGGGAEGSS